MQLTSATINRMVRMMKPVMTANRLVTRLCRKCSAVELDSVVLRPSITNEAMCVKRWTPVQMKMTMEMIR